MKIHTDSTGFRFAEHIRGTLIYQFKSLADYNDFITRFFNQTQLMKWVEGDGYFILNQKATKRLNELINENK